MEPSLSTYSRMDEVGNTTADTTPESFNAHSAELDTNEADVNQASARNGGKFKSKSVFPLLPTNITIKIRHPFNVITEGFIQSLKGFLKSLTVFSA
jgi:hypothetical protein